MTFVISSNEYSFPFSLNTAIALPSKTPSGLFSSISNTPAQSVVANSEGFV
jgi:hypothetical protein